MAPPGLAFRYVSVVRWRGAPRHTRHKRLATYTTSSVAGIGRLPKLMRARIWLLTGCIFHFAGCCSTFVVAQQARLELSRDPAELVLINRTTGERVTLSDIAPLVEFDGFEAGGRIAGNGVWRRTARRWTAEWVWDTGFRVRAVWEMDPGSAVLHKYAEIKLASGQPALLRHVTLDEVDATGQSPQGRPGIQSQPVFGRSFFLGVAFPMASARADGSRVILSHSPGVYVKPGVWYRSRTAVYGAAPSGKAREAFQAYVASLRPRPQGIHFNYNSWWTSPVPYTEADILKIVRAFRDNLYRPYGVSPDSFCIDMGWAKNTTLWKIDPALFPKGFTGIRRACEAIGSHPGLWISPSGVYGQALDLSWARKAGYEADSKACLGGPNYRQEFTRSLVDVVTRYGIRHVKFDGYVPTCDAADHGHQPGALSAEAIAQGMIDVFASLRSAAPECWFEPTCFGPEASPWWLAYCNSVTGAFGDDAPHGRVPCPIYRESYTTGRDYYNLKGARDILFPIASQEVLGIIHQTGEPMEDDAVVNVLRGNQFISLYVNPARMSARGWGFLATLMKWARRNQDVLANTRPILPDSWRRAGGGPTMGRDAPMPREPYGYAHWLGRRGLVCLRNPWIEEADVRLNPSNDCGAASHLNGLTARLIYPDQRILARGLNADRPFTIHLHPYETVVVDIGPSGPGGEPSGLMPNRSTQSTVTVTATCAEETDSGPAYGRDYTRASIGPGPHLRLRVHGPVVANGAGTHELLLLIEDSAPVTEPLCRFAVNGHKTPVRFLSSESGWRATGAPVPEHWLWAAIPLQPGVNRVDADVTLASASQKVAGWVVSLKAEGRTLNPKMAHRPFSLHPSSFSPQIRYLCSTRAFAAQSLRPDLPVEKVEAPVVRIAGVYLDTLEPVTAEQGWGALQRNRSVWEKPIMVGGRRFLRGIGTHARSRIVYDLGGVYRRFQCWAGADQATGPTITMAVRVDGRTVWSSGPLTRDSPARRVDVDVSGARRLELLVGDGGNGISADHADWADAMLVR